MDSRNHTDAFQDSIHLMNHRDSYVEYAADQEAQEDLMGNIIARDSRTSRTQHTQVSIDDRAYPSQIRKHQVCNPATELIRTRDILTFGPS